MFTATLKLSRPVYVRTGFEEWEPTGDRDEVDVVAEGDVILAADEKTEDAVHIRSIRVNGKKEQLGWLSKEDRAEVENALVDVACGRKP